MPCQLSIKLNCQINLTANRNFCIRCQGMQTTQIQLWQDS